MPTWRQWGQHGDEGDDADDIAHDGDDTGDDEHDIWTMVMALRTTHLTRFHETSPNIFFI